MVKNELCKECYKKAKKQIQGEDIDSPTAYLESLSELTKEIEKKTHNRIFEGNNFKLELLDNNNEDCENTIELFFKTNKVDELDIEFQKLTEGKDYPYSEPLEFSWTFKDTVFFPEFPLKKRIWLITSENGNPYINKRIHEAKLQNILPLIWCWCHDNFEDEENSCECTNFKRSSMEVPL